VGEVSDINMPPLAVMLAVDTSGSMAEPFTGNATPPFSLERSFPSPAMTTRLQASVDVARSVIEQLPDDSLVVLVSFHSQVRTWRYVILCEQWPVPAP
jgi:hypothetical protein